MNPEDYNELFETQDGSHSLISHQFGVSYHSKYGAIQESEHVFIDAGLKARLSLDDAPISVLEFGFGTGLNALLSYQLAEALHRPVYYEGMEAYPVAASLVEQLNYAEQLGIAPSIFQELHAASWGDTHALGAYFSFRKIEMSFEHLDAEAAFDVIYFDAFAPSAQAELWEAPLLQKAYRALRPRGYLVTYCAKGVVKRTLKSLGFRLETLPGPPGKREMTRCIKPGASSS